MRPSPALVPLPASFAPLFEDPEELTNWPRPFRCCGCAVRIIPVGCGLIDVLVPPWVPDVIAALYTLSIDGHAGGRHEFHAALRHLSRRPSLRAELLTLSRVAPKVFRQRLRTLRRTFKPCPTPHL